MIYIIKNLSGISVLSAGLGLLLVLIISLTLHEYAHGYIAYKNGDMTAKVSGRLTINPIAHIDLIGFFSCFFFGFGWAKPIPINPMNFRNYKKGMVLTSFAGVIVNLVLAFIGCGLYYVCIRFLTAANFGTLLLLYFSYFLFTINISLFIFNLIPVYPLDGFKVIESLTKPGNKFVSFMKMYGSLLLLALVLCGGILLSWLVKWISMPIEMFWEWVVF